MSSRHRSPSSGSPSLGLRVAMAGAAVAAAIGATTAACLSVSPSSLAGSTLARPAILHDAVVPTASAFLVSWPEDDTFIVPVAVGVSGEPFYYDVFIDYDPTANNGAGTGPVVPPQVENPTPESLDGGLVIVQFVLAPPDPTSCHTIEFLVAHAFDATSPHTPDSVGGDVVTWFYTAGDVNGCPQADGGASPYGADDAEADGPETMASSGSP